MASFPVNNARSNEVTKRTAVFVKRPLNNGNEFKFTRLQYDIVELGYRGGNREKSFVQPFLNTPAYRRAGSTQASSATTKAEWVEQYDDIKILSPVELATFQKIGWTNV